ncbi:haloacid dehalogenase type II [Fictibacillus sp. KU28468]|uniref:haloacid dehalogenase type II n=1 Tax=Fictibacillus sp. KU28468 TaxID=2991053 RepID=UPI00223CC1F6|nr:haloacid dehalogenase type II [Fictibacillus sp. KU28468]UZJ80175.1 haloacid dehalogenase type II [Fictibacillus sp. KU28468]
MSTEIKAFVFDVYGTLFDVHSVKEKCEEFYPGKGEKISQIWRTKQIEYSNLRQLMGNYETFLTITNDALKYAIKASEEEWGEEKEKALIEAYLQLTHYPEVERVLVQLKDKSLAVFSNGSHDMLDPLIQQSGLSPLFDAIISVDEVKQYKPTPASYDHALKTLNVKREEVLFMSSNGWDISGAKNFGFRTAWINRNELPIEELNLAPDTIYSDLNGILEWK